MVSSSGEKKISGSVKETADREQARQDITFLKRLQNAIGELHFHSRLDHRLLPLTPRRAPKVGMSGHKLLPRAITGSRYGDRRV